MAKDTEKLIRQLSLISYLMAERRPVTATEIRRDVEGYSDMTEDAFARRFYADRAELDALGIHLTVDKPADGFSEQENYSLAPEAFHLPAIAFTDSERAALQTALTLLDGEFAYAEPLRLALQQITWGRPSPLGVGLAADDRPRHHGLGRRRRALRRGWRRSTPRSTAASGSSSSTTRCSRRDGAAQGRPVPPAVRGRAVLPRRLLARARRGARVPALPHPRQGRVLDQGRARLPAPRGLRPARVRQPRSRGSSATRSAPAEVWVSEKIAWYVERQFGAYGEMLEAEDGGRIFRTRVRDAAAARRLGAAASARTPGSLGPPELVDEARERIDAIIERHTRRADRRRRRARARARGARAPRRTGRRRGGEAAIRPERFARLVTLASVLIAAGREERRLPVAEVLRAAADLRAGAARGRRRCSTSSTSAAAPT